MYFIFFNVFYIFLMVFIYFKCVLSKFKSSSFNRHIGDVIDDIHLVLALKETIVFKCQLSCAKNVAKVHYYSIIKD